MLKFQTNGVIGSKVFNLPTSIGEITPEHLLKVTEDVELADNYCLIALCYKEKLSNIIMMSRQKKNDVSTAVVPLFIKHGVITSNDSYKPSFVSTIDAGTRIIIAGSQLALGHHVVCPRNTLDVNTFLKCIEKDGFAYQNATSIKDYIYFLEFKIIPANDIVGTRPLINTDFDNPFAIEDIATDIAGNVN